MSWWRWFVAWLRARFIRFARRQLIGEHAVVDHAKRARLRTEPLTDAHRLLLDTWFPPFGRLSKAQRAKFVADLQVLLGEKPVEADGVELDDRIRLIVAASAALMVAGLDVAVFDHVTRIVVRKEPFAEHGPNVTGRYRHTEYPIAGRHGEVELIWSAVIAAAERAEGEHVVVHEFAHAFDHGLELLQKHADRPAWEAALTKLPLVTLYMRTHTITHIAGSVEGPELFATSSEMFFEVPRRLATVAPSLFDELRAIYNIDPRTFTTK
ncbi:MAG: zinc-dependent peptidase [Kofleriaceae bacterium]